MYKMASCLIDFFLPHTCVLCGKISGRSIDMCEGCELQLPWIHNSCERCGFLLDPSSRHKLCGHCLSREFIFDKTRVPFLYQGKIIPLITRLKFYDQLSYAKLLGEYLARTVSAGIISHDVEAIIPVPLHESRLKARGFNQALEIARVLSQTLRIPIDPQSCVRIKKTAPQTELSAEERVLNLQKAFWVREKLEYAKVALVDDVVTTGHTAFECAKALKQAGVKSIELWCCARSALPFK